MVAERFGWTLDYVDGLDALELDGVIAVLDAVDRGRAHIQERQARKRTK